MKKLFVLLALAGAGTACQQQAPPTQAAAAPTGRAPAAPPVGRVMEAAPVIPQFLAQHSLARVLQTVTDLKADGGPHLYNGFFGPSHRRIEVVFTRVTRDEDRPNVYYIQGRNRYKGLITPFAGTLTFTQLVEQPHYSKKELRSDALTELFDPTLNKEAMYTATGNFVLREDSTRKNSGVFRGSVALDVRLDPASGLRLQTRTDHTLTRSGEAKFEGSWVPYGGASPKPVVWVENIFAYGPQVFNNFTIGERDADFNPKYAKLGWNTYWTNDEWWTDGYRETARSAPLRRVLFTPPVANASDSLLVN